MPVRLLSLLLVLWSAPPPSLAAETSTCLTVYREGGAPAVFRSPRCPRWTLFHDEDHGRGRRSGPVSNCQVATHQGRRRSQEDRAVCALDIRIPFIGEKGFKDEVSVGIVAVFDGHNGAEASEMASQLLVDYFFLHVYFLLDGVYSSAVRGSTERLTYKGEGDVMLQGIHLGVGQGQHNVDPGRFKWILSKPFDGPLLIEILKESLLRAIHDIDASFSKEASRKSLESGSTATIVLIVEGQILVANVGDSKAIMCSESLYPPHEFKGKHSKFKRKRRHKDVVPFNKDNEIFNLPTSVGPYLYAKELTKDHHPDRDEERKRVEAAGGFVKDWAGVPRVNGELAVSRAIGDVPYKKYGVISVPEVTDWLPLYNNDSYLVVASDGIYEKLTAQEVCDLLWDVNVKVNINSELISTITHALADLVVNAAFERGSMDNMAAIVIPLASTRNFPIKDGCHSEGRFQGMSCVSNVKHTKSDSDAVASSLISMEYFNRIEMKFNRLPVKANPRRVGCFYLAEDLNENMDYVFRAPEGHPREEIYEITQALPEGLGHNSSGWSLNLYTGQNFCWNFDIGNEKDKGQCINPEGFIKFLGLLSSIPLNDSGLHSSESFNYKNPDFRYVLKRKFDRGSYGEVWLAFQWNCSEESGGLNRFPTNLTYADSHLYSHEGRHTNSSIKHNFTETDNDHYFILKRIMVERGNTAYLSGLREKYFGELFLNASISLDRTAESGLSTAIFTGAQYGSSCLLGMNEPVLPGTGNTSSPLITFPSNFKLASVVYEEGLDHIARFVESFESQSKEIWLVFRNEGLSLSKLIYTVEEKKLFSNNEGNQEKANVQVLHPSAWWHWLRTTEAGKKEMRNLIWQLLLALKSCHERNITHRDIKPENMIICFQDVDTGKCLRGIPSEENRYNIKMRIIDFGSAIDEFTIKYLYGSGPSRSEQTFEYMSPEALLNVSWFQGPKSTTLKYDMWSVGVVFMELILGSPHVFQISDRTRALLDHHLEGWGENMKELAYKLRSLMEMCILIPGVSPQHRQGGVKDHGGFSPASWKCTEEFFGNQVKNRDPLKLGFPNIWALRLVRQLLVWHPEDRLSVDDALKHPYFQLDL